MDCTSTSYSFFFFCVGTGTPVYVAKWTERDVMSKYLNLQVTQMYDQHITH